MAWLKLFCLTVIIVLAHSMTLEKELIVCEEKPDWSATSLTNDDVTHSNIPQRNGDVEDQMKFFRDIIRRYREKDEYKKFLDTYEEAQQPNDSEYYFSGPPAQDNSKDNKELKDEEYLDDPFTEDEIYDFDNPETTTFDDKYNTYDEKRKLVNEYDPSILDHVSNDVDSYMTKTNDNEKQDTNNEDPFVGVKDMNYFKGIEDTEKETSNGKDERESDNTDASKYVDFFNEQRETKTDDNLSEQQETKNEDILSEKRETKNHEILSEQRESKKDVNLNEQRETKNDDIIREQQETKTDDESENFSLSRFTNELRRDIDMLKSKNNNNFNNFDWSNIKERDDLYNAYDAKQKELLNNHENLLNHPDDSYVEYDDYEDFE